MGHVEKKRQLYCCLAAVLCYLLLAVAAQLLLRNLYRFLPSDTAFPAIFFQLRTAAMYTPVLPFVLAGYLSCLLLSRIAKGRLGWLAAMVLIPMFLVTLIAGAVFFTTVNDVRFGDILLSLLEMLEKGGLDGL